RAVRQVVGAELAREQAVEERGLVAGAPRRVERRLIGRAQRAELAGDELERRLPGDGPVVRRPALAQHRVREPASPLEPVVALPEQLGDAVGGEELRGAARPRGFAGDGLRAVLAELERLPRLGVGPGAARAVV